MKLYIRIILIIVAIGMLFSVGATIAIRAQDSIANVPGETIYIRNLSESKWVIFSVPFFAQDFIFRVEERKPIIDERESPPAALIGGSYIEVAAETRGGEAVHDIPEGMRISIRISQLADADASKLALYAFREERGAWELISDATFSNDGVEFTTKKLSLFAIFEMFPEIAGIQAVLPFVGSVSPLFDVEVRPSPLRQSVSEQQGSIKKVIVVVAVLIGVVVGVAVYILRRKKYAP